MTDTTAALARFDAAIALARGADQAYAALQALVQETVGAKLFTVMEVDLQAGVARRAYTSDAVNYPGSGTKPVVYDAWFDTMQNKREYFVANTIEDIAKVLFDHELINALGCQSIVNMPVVIGDVFVGTVNMLDVAWHFTPERVEMIREVISVPAKLAVVLARG
ncbi:GAF domain-containing protein [Devosia sp. YR412]|uniref:GAF domain-containing protein n=1 Tax=Devosia sp. YR412 TaxID=1881030 RepID=UPI000B883CE7|nr:GAF domain-containing protein [Devosia sp. YR412]